MGLPFRLFTGAYTFLMMSIALFILTCGILGKKIKGRPLAVFCIAAQVLQWLIGVVAPLLMLLASASDDMALSPAFDILTYTPVALFLGWQLAREFRLPFLHTLTAAVLGTFIANTASMDADDLLRAVGILLDNAIEAAAKRDGLVRVVLLQEENQLYLAIANNYDVAPDMAALARKGYTTKGSGHGTGLSSYRRIVARCRGCAMRTYLKDGMFVQELHIPTI